MNHFYTKISSKQSCGDSPNNSVASTASKGTTKYFIFRHWSKNISKDDTTKKHPEHRLDSYSHLSTTCCCIKHIYRGMYKSPRNWRRNDASSRFQHLAEWSPPSVDWTFHRKYENLLVYIFQHNFVIVTPTQFVLSTSQRQLQHMQRNVKLPRTNSEFFDCLFYSWLVPELIVV